MTAYFLSNISAEIIKIGWHTSKWQQAKAVSFLRHSIERGCTNIKFNLELRHQTEQTGSRSGLHLDSFHFYSPRVSRFVKLRLHTEKHVIEYVGYSRTTTTTTRETL